MNDHLGDHHAEERRRDQQIVAHTRNTARYFTENRHIAWVALIATFAWGIYGYSRMPKSKDPVVEVRIAAAACIWPGADAEKVEQLVTRKIEQKLAENASVEKIESISRTGVSIVYVVLKESVVDRAKEWDNIQGRLDSIHNLPQGAGPIQFQRDFGDTTTLMLTVASPKVNDVELQLRAAAVAQAITAVRGAGARSAPGESRATIVISFPSDINNDLVRRVSERLARQLDARPGTGDARLIDNPGFVGIDVATTLDDAALLARFTELTETQLQASDLHPDVWSPAVVRDPKDAQARLTQVAGDRYSHRQLDQVTEQIQRSLQRVPSVATVARIGVLAEQIHLEYSQERLASYGLPPSALGAAIATRNITAPGGVLDVAGKNVPIAPTGEFSNEQQIGGVVVATSAAGSPVYLRDLVDIRRGYQSPAQFLNYLTARDRSGAFERTRAITLAVNMRRGEQIAEFGKQIDAELASIQRMLPDDLILLRTSDQPLQVSENVALFMRSLYEAMILILLVAFIGFWEWRTPLLLGLCIPITLAMTFGMMQALGLDIQQISVGSLIISLGLLIDDPVVAADAIKNALAAGWKARVAAWLGPTKLATAILFATLTNIAAYLPFLTLPGDSGVYLHSLPVVLALALIASRIVSMTFVPLLGSSILRTPRRLAPSAEQRRSRGFGKVYCGIVGWAINHRLLAFGISIALLGLAGFYTKDIKSAFFPKDLQYLSFVDIWLPEDASLEATRRKAVEVSHAIEVGAAEWSRQQGKPDSVLVSITEFDGGGGPRFWWSVSPEIQQLNYAQLLIQIRVKEDMSLLVPYLQARVDKIIAGARVDVREIDSGKPVGIPVSIRLSGESIPQLRALAEQAKEILRATPGATRVRDDWGADTFTVKLEVDSDRANLANVTNLDVAQSSAAAMTGAPVGVLRDGDRELPIITRLRPEERAQLSEIENLYVGAENGQKVPLGQVSRIRYGLQTEKIRRRNQFRTVTVSAYPADGVLPSEVLKAAMPRLEEFRKAMPGDYQFEIGGEAEEQTKSFLDMAVVFGLLFAAIYLTLVLQFRNAVKPLIVFVALPYGATGAVVGLVVMGAPMSFMAMLGIISLMGVIVSHVIVLFDFIEDAHQRGAPMREALLDAGMMRLRPVVITTIATVFGLIPLAVHGGPLWQPLCYAQIAGLSFAIFVTLILVPVLYTILVKDLKMIKWDTPPGAAPTAT